MPPAVKTALTKFYKQREQDRVVRSSDLLPVMALPGQKKTTKKPARLKLVTVEDAADGELDKDADAGTQQQGPRLFETDHFRNKRAFLYNL